MTAKELYNVAELMKEQQEEYEILERKLHMIPLCDNYEELELLSKEILEGIDYQAVIVMEFMKMNLSDNERFEKLLQELYRLRKIVESNI